MDVGELVEEIGELIVWEVGDAFEVRDAVLGVGPCDVFVDATFV
jgi:hypothetical protein